MTPKVVEPVKYDKFSRRELRLRAFLSRILCLIRPRDAAVWYDLGLAYKYLHDWRRCAAANLRAVSIYGESSYAGWWNLGIAATALRDWALARRAWRAFGLDVPDGDGPIELDWHKTPVRIADGEVVWAKRIDPARARIESIPFPESGIRRGDIVLNDGAANGEREVQGRKYPVFDCLELFERSGTPTICVDVFCASDDDSSAVVEAFADLNYAAEDWTTSVVPLCQACSEGLPDEFHAHDRINFHPEQREFGIAAPLDRARTVLEEWVRGSPSTRSFGDLEVVD